MFYIKHMCFIYSFPYSDQMCNEIEFFGLYISQGVRNSEFSLVLWNRVSLLNVSAN